MSEPRDDLTHEQLKAVLNRETARIRWHELQPQFARGQVISVAPELDLIEVASELIRDNTTQVTEWRDTGSLGPVEASTAQGWYDEDATVWAVVVAPWVLVQAAA